MPKYLLLFIAGTLFITLLLSTQQALKTVNFNCSTLDYKCYENYYSALVKTQEVKEAFNDLKLRYENDPFAKMMCHPLVHALGRAASLKLATTSEAFAQGDNFCSSGYFHGVLEGVTGKIGRQKILESLNNICRDFRVKNVYSLDYYNCVHGLGHGLMAITDDELFVSLDYCEKLNGDWEQKSCASGVFMENIVADGINHKTKYLKNDDLLYPCNQSPEKLKESCYLMQSSYILRQNRLDFKKTFDVCESAGKPYNHKCYQSLGRDASGFTISDISSTKNICLLGKDFDQILGCFIGAAKDFKYYFGDNIKASKLCESSENPSITKDCLKEI